MEMYTTTQTAVEETLKHMKLVCLAMDVWEDDAHYHIIGFTVHAMMVTRKPLVILLERCAPVANAWCIRHFLICRMTCRHTSEVIAEYIDRAVRYVQQFGCKVIGLQADNAANVQKASMDMGAIHKYLSLNCYAHSAQLLLKDLLSLWGPILAKAEDVEAFFRRGYPKAVYEQEMQVTQGTLLSHPAEARPLFLRGGGVQKRKQWCEGNPLGEQDRPAAVSGEEHEDH